MVYEITDINDERLNPFVRLTEAELRNRLEPEKGIFIAESPKVISIALNMGYEPLSLLCEKKHIHGDAKSIIERIGDTGILTGSRELLEKVTGYKLTRGVLCAMRRPAIRPLSEILENAHRVVILDSVTDTTNIGAIFRSAAALGVDAVLLTPTTCDPLNRRAVRVSMGSVFLIPWTWLDSEPGEVKKYGFKTVAMALTDRSVNITNPEMKAEERLAIIMGTEGDGLNNETIDRADYVCRIPMYHHVDSLNVAVASGIAIWELCKRELQG